VFAEAAGRRLVWHDALKEWNMTESQQVLEWMAQGEVKGEIKALLLLLHKKFPPGPSPDLVSFLQSCKDSTLVTRWLAAAIDAASLDDFHRAVGA
jgi:hypothetical protein